VDVFALRNHIIQQYADYTSSFLNILDPDIREHVDQELSRGRLWPDSLIQLSPAYDQASTVAELVQNAVLGNSATVEHFVRRACNGLGATLTTRRLREGQQRARAQVSGGRVKVERHLPPDVLGVYVLLPAQAGGA
jgi:hypothetical protein